MSPSKSFQPNPELDLVLERVVDVPRELVWAAWTTPEHLKKWFTPKPWETVDCEIDLRPGGIFRTLMRSPEGEEFPGVGCYLEVIPNEKLVWTDALDPGYRPTNSPPSVGSSHLTAVITLEPHERGTKYTAMAIHRNRESRIKHEEMGFYHGWATALDQMVAMIKAMQGSQGGQQHER